MKKVFTLVATSLLFVSIGYGQILDYKEWGQDKDNDGVIDVPLDPNLEIYDYTKLGQWFIQFKSSDMGADKTGYIVFPAKDISSFGPSLKASFEFSVKMNGTWTGDFDLLVTNDYTNDPTTTSWAAVSTGLLQGKSDWNNDWITRQMTEVEFANQNYTNAVFAIRVKDDDPDAVDKAGRIYAFKLFDPLVTALGDEMESDLSVYPNPATDVINIRNCSASANVSVCSITGEMVVHNTSLTNHQLDVSGLSAGSYLLIIEEADAREIVKFIKK
jgi:hypothetical protein